MPDPARPDPAPQLSCGFCERPRDEVEFLVVGAGGHICAGCVEVVAEVFATEDQLRAAGWPAAPHPPDPQAPRAPTPNLSTPNLPEPNSEARTTTGVAWLDSCSFCALPRTGSRPLVLGDQTPVAMCRECCELGLQALAEARAQRRG